MEQPYRQALTRLPAFVRSILLRVPSDIAAAVTEIRLRSGRPVVLTLPAASLFVEPDGRCQTTPTDKALFCSADMLQECFLGLCGHSVYTYENDLSQGFFTLPGGHRVGVAGRSVRQKEYIAGIQEVSSLNIRIARTELLQLDGALCELLQNARPRILVLGEPGTGKTTLLRAMTSRLSDFGKRVAVVDERMEIWPLGEKGFSSDIPLHCDVLSGYPKGAGMQYALRSLSPEILVCDEIGAAEDAAALEISLHAGTGVLASAHASSVEDIRYRPQLRYMFKQRLFDDIVLLQSRHMPGRIGGIYHACDLMQSFGRYIDSAVQPGRWHSMRQPADATQKSGTGCGGSFKRITTEFAV